MGRGQVAVNLLCPVDEAGAADDQSCADIAAVQFHCAAGSSDLISERRHVAVD